MRRGLVGAFFLSILLLAGATPPPLTVKDVSLLLRAGYSNGAVLQELSARHFADTLDLPKETVLSQSGATTELITALKSGNYSVPPDQAAAAKEQLDAEAKRRAAQAEEALKFNTLYQSQLAQKRASVRFLGPAGNFIQPLVKGDLISWHNGALARFDDEALEKKKLIALYFSAHWCPPCRKFTPQLVEYYNRVAPQHPEFEIIFVSFDRSQFAMETYMREASMPWPAIDFARVPGKDAIRKYAGEGIPCLVLVDASGKVISDSFAGKQYLGPGKVLADLDVIFARVADGSVVTSQ